LPLAVLRVCRILKQAFDVSVNPNGDEFMAASTIPVRISARPTIRVKATRGVVIGRILSGLAIAFLSFDAIIKIVVIPAVAASSVQLGYPVSTMVPIGITLLSCVLLYAIPATSAFGALLLTGYLGGAVATHVRIGNPLFSHILFPGYVALLVWGGLYLRDARLRQLVTGR
jgi:hypothetical protein